MGFWYMPPIVVSGGGGGTVDFQHTFHEINASEALAKQLNLPSSPADVSAVMVIAQGGGSLRYNVAYTLTGTLFDWNGMTMDGLLSEGDVLEFYYAKA